MEIILDVDVAERSLRDALAQHWPIEGLWGFKLGDEILKHGMTTALCPFAKKHKVFVDLKHHDVRGRLARIVKLYADLGEYAPKFLTICGKSDQDAITEAVSVRGTIDIIVTGILSDQKRVGTEEDDQLEHMEKALQAGAQGITCPVDLLPEIDWQADWDDGHIVATGVVSEGVDPRHHREPRPPAFALKYGATHAVIGTEVIAAEHPLSALQDLCSRYKIQRPAAVGLVVDKVV